MTPKAIETFSSFGVGVLCAVLGIVALAVFFTALNWLNTRDTVKKSGRGTEPVVAP